MGDVHKKRAPHGARLMRDHGKGNVFPLALPVFATAGWAPGTDSAPGGAVDSHDHGLGLAKRKREGEWHAFECHNQPHNRKTSCDYERYRYERGEE